ncbi:thiol peroxidase [Alkalicoccus luteus]|uniref:Thiol peroxidase n=1 Tax=Alkalicoccus luteus TaxID=1237094 RepID=A0A969PRB8_9BACI|nr:thiol peroxidase [Alkalicoccus luteus]NJP36991.1 thiol peroxidase [Alkalicoccus luteus]
MGITFKDKPVTLSGEQPQTGEKAPSFTVLGTDLSEVTFEAGTKTLISVVPSIDTSTCDKQTRTFNEEAAAVDNAEIWTISADLPFAQRRWCANAGLEGAHIYSDHKTLDFGMAYGLVIEELRLLSRAVFVVDSSGTIVYSEVVGEVSGHPDYEKAVEALKQAE